MVYSLVSVLRGVCDSSCPVVSSRQRSRNEPRCSLITPLNEGCYRDTHLTVMLQYWSCAIVKL